MCRQKKKKKTIRHIRAHLFYFRNRLWTEFYWITRNDDMKLLDLFIFSLIVSIQFPQTEICFDWKKQTNSLDRRFVSTHFFRPLVTNCLMAFWCFAFLLPFSDQLKKKKGAKKWNGMEQRLEIQVTMQSNIIVQTQNKYLKLKLKLKHCSCDVEENNGRVRLPYTVYCTVYRVTSMYGLADLVGRSSL